MESSSPILSQLRQATAETHQQLEDAVQIEQRIATAERYRDLLAKFWGFYAPLEPKLEMLGGWEQWGLDLAGRRKTPWLAADLLALGETKTGVALLPRTTQLPTLQTHAQAFGCLYVVEGSTLGGRHISSLLQKSSTPATARHFFASYGPEVGPKWKEFLAALDQFAAGQPDSGQEIVGAANETFACIQAWLCGDMAR